MARLAAEFLGSAFLAAIVIGSGIAAQRLSPSDTGLELLENAAATAAGLFAIILMFGPVSGAHFNPVVSFADAALGGLSWRDAAAYLPAQVAGCVTGAVAREPDVRLAAVSDLGQAPGQRRARAVGGDRHRRAGPGDLRARPDRPAASAPAAVGAYIGAAYWFTSSTSFANPAITVGRMFSNTFAGIAPSSVPVFIAAQIGGGIAGVVIIRILYPALTPAQAAGAVVPHDSADGQELAGLAKADGDGGTAGAAPAGLAG